MTSNEVDLKCHELAGGVVVDVISVIFVLVATAEPRVAVVSAVVLGYCILNGAGDVCGGFSTKRHIRSDNWLNLPFTRAVVTAAPHNSNCFGPVCEDHQF